MLLSRKAYLESGGFDAIGYSITEDRDLLAAFYRKRLKVTTAEPFSPTAITAPAPGFREYSHQLLRWVYGGFRGRSNITVFGALIGMQNIFLVLALTRTLPCTVSLFACGNLLLTWLFVSIAFRKLNSKESTLFFLPFYALLLIESFALIASIIFKRSLTWKDRRLSWTV
jgi:1,2-diacylglycerol 3-beta-glucosyltransferase